MRKSIVILAVLMSACATENGSSNDEALSEVEQQVLQAAELGDHRLYAMSGRKVTLPGLAPEVVEQAKRKCGFQFLPNSGDVMKSDTDRSQRKAQFQFAKAYNQLMYKRCLGE